MSKQSHQLFGLSQITDEEAVLFAKMLLKGFVDDEGNEHPPKSQEETLKELNLINDLLILQRTQSLMLRRSPSIRKQIKARISLELGMKQTLHGGEYKEIPS